MSISAAERNRRKRERKKAEKKKKEEEEKSELIGVTAATADSADTIISIVKKEDIPTTADKPEEGGIDDGIKVEYVPEPIATPEVSTVTTTTSGFFFLDTQPQLYEDSNDVNEKSSTTEHNFIIDSTKQEEHSNDDDNDILAVLRRFALRASVVSPTDEDTNLKAGHDSDEDTVNTTATTDDNNDDDDDTDSFISSTKRDQRKKKQQQKKTVGGTTLSRRKIREWVRPTVAELKQKVSRPDLVEAHDVTAADPEFLLYLKSVPNTVPVPRHWGRKRKYLQGKRGIEKAPWPLPHFLRQTGITEIRSSQAAEEAKQSLKQKQRQRVQVRSGIDVDYKTLYDAFFKYQTKPPLTTFGDLYYEGKEFELRSTSGKFVPGALSDRLREALGMTTSTVPPPWLMNMQRYGPPPTYPSLTIPGLNAPLPEGCSYGFHPGGWGKPPVDPYGRGLYGDVFGPPTEGRSDEGWKTTGPDVITSDGKKLSRSFWGALPSVKHDDEEEEESEEEEEEKVEGGSTSEEEVEEGEEKGSLRKEGMAAVEIGGVVLPTDGLESVVPSSAVDLRKAAGDETPAPKQLYTILETRDASKDNQGGAYFQSETTYVLPTDTIKPSSSSALDASGIESVLSKAPKEESSTKRSRRDLNDEEEDDLGKKFKF